MWNLLNFFRFNYIRLQKHGCNVLSSLRVGQLVDNRVDYLWIASSTITLCYLVERW